LAGFLPEGAVKPTLHGGFEEAFEEALLTGLPVLVAGSLYLVGEARAWLTGGDFQSCSQ
jgi:folylpolyglutamate synthase/dihydropteroate synthase